jgi:hypothetical protein
VTQVATQTKGGHMGLTVKTVEKIIREGKAGATADGDGLYLRITPQGSSSWQFRYTIAGKRRLMGLGGCGDVGLAEARDLAAEARKKLKQGIDPLEAKIQDEATQQAKLVTFEDLARDYIKLHRAGWKTPNTYSNGKTLCAITLSQSLAASPFKRWTPLWCWMP